jgi:DinB superfamily
MNQIDSIFLRGVSKQLTEVFDGPPTAEAYVVNPGDPGLLRQLETMSAQTASLQPIPGKPSIAAHVHHIYFGLLMLNRWVSGEENPWAGADFGESWRKTTVSEDEWRTLRQSLRHEAEAWRRAVVNRTQWDDLSASAAISTVAHTAYHLGAIRQILAATS